MRHIDHLRKIVRDSYSKDQEMDKFTKRVGEELRRWGRTVVERFFPTEGEVLVVGCGVGREAFALEKLGIHVTGEMSHRHYLPRLNRSQLSESVLPSCVR